MFCCFFFVPDWLNQTIVFGNVGRGSISFHLFLTVDSFSENGSLICGKIWISLNVYKKMTEKWNVNIKRCSYQFFPYYWNKCVIDKTMLMCLKTDLSGLKYKYILKYFKYRHAKTQRYRISWKVLKCIIIMKDWHLKSL
jgi:hypothetical protein